MRSGVDQRLLCAEGVTRTTGPSVAERELKAALGALGARRTRKEAGDAEPVPAPPSASSTSKPPPTFAPAAVPPATNKEWNDFIAANHSRRLQISIYYITFLALINCLQTYEYSNISVTDNYIALRRLQCFHISGYQNQAYRLGWREHRGLNGVARCVGMCWRVVERKPQVAERSPAGADRYPVTLGLKAELFGRVVSRDNPRSTLRHFRIIT
ncbi:hypothetical protein B5X24_HaOG207297 [Helicoverpa armigera]|uniref:Uncharacterized protein n=1 Tax=Helicoverpa armigera TaxID=29058 RepID=A0A2W1BPR3_HELAM|nr:hypothetical protein B5X24_HaOG207297 [Helicoverpa armigera]